MKFMTTFLVVVLVLIIAAVAVPLDHTVTVTTSRSLLGIDLGAGDAYRITFRGTTAEYFDGSALAGRLLAGVDCTPESLHDAYAAAGFTEVHVARISIR